MKKLYIILLILLSAKALLSAQTVDYKDAYTAALNFWFEYTGDKISKEEFTGDSITALNHQAAIYVFNKHNEKGFVLISANKDLAPVIAYSVENTFRSSNTPPNVSFWIQSMAEGIANYQSKTGVENKNAETDWIHYTTKEPYFQPKAKHGKSVLSLTNHIKWGQADGWNAACPVNNFGERSLTGCVATAMGILMKYYEYPASGNGRYTYTPPGYSEQTVIFSQNTYNYASMPDASPSTEAAKLQYHAGVSVQMQFGTEASSAYSADVRDALWFYFLYEYPAFSYRKGYSDAQWFDMIKKELDAQRPIFYGGEGDIGGHAFICDGYDNSDRYHFNFGWDGYNNGFYNIDASNFLFPENQEMLTGLYPDYSFDAKEQRTQTPEDYPTVNNDCRVPVIYPNPAREHFTAEFSEEIQQIEIRSITGQLIHIVQGGGKHAINFLAPGIYRINTITDSQNFSNKLVKM